MKTKTKAVHVLPGTSREPVRSSRAGPEPRRSYLPVSGPRLLLLQPQVYKGRNMFLRKVSPVALDVVLGGEVILGNDVVFSKADVFAMSQQ